jgi:hypothetical protein
MQRAMRRHLLYAVALVVAGCGNPLDHLGPVPGPDVSGTWSGSTVGVTLSVTLGSDSCSFNGEVATCGGSITGGAFSDKAISSHGTFTNPPAGNQIGAYAVDPPSDTSSFSSPLPGWTMRMASSDSATPPPTTVMTFGGTFSTTTTITGSATFTNGTATDSVTLTLTKQ